MISSLADLQRLGKHNCDANMQLIAEWNQGWQAITAETIDFASRTFEDGAATLEKLFSAKSIEHALEISSGFANPTFSGKVGLSAPVTPICANSRR